MAALVRLRIDLATGAVDRRTFPTGNANEFPRINPHYVAAPHRYVYIASNPPDRGIGLQQRVSRVDLSTGATVSHDFAPHGYPGEPVFIPAQPAGSGAEDEGFVVTLVFDGAANRTQIVGLDARDLAAAPLFVARLRHHVPYSLHGTFTPRRF
jgi:all-trans-8'-apo-beta-carotenal 15,15'-oxygenase